MKARSPLDGAWYYFIDKCLPFGTAISCALFQAVSDALAHIVQYRTKKKPINYLDDYLFAAALRTWCNSQIKAFIDVCGEIGLPVALNKTSWSDTIMIFLGFLIDTVNQVISVPTEKVAKGLNMINYLLQKQEKPAGKGKMTILQLKKVCGFLNFLGRAIVPGRSLTRHLYSHLAGSAHLKPHHHITISNDIFEDLLVWRRFLQHQSVYCRLFLDFTTTLMAEQLQFYTDASKNFLLGFGGYFHSEWMQECWDEQLEPLDPSIQWMELYTLAAGVLAWGSKLTNKRVIIFCDNRAVVGMINKTSSSCQHCMKIIRKLVLFGLIHNFRIFARYVESLANEIADSLSRFQSKRFYKLTKDMNMNPFKTPVPTEIWPPSTMW